MVPTSCSAAPAGQAGNLLVEVMLASEASLADSAAENNERGNSQAMPSHLFSGQASPDVRRGRAQRRRNICLTCIAYIGALFAAKRKQKV